MDITFDALTKRYGSFVALQPLRLHVPEGTFFGLLGANGAGKTTTLRCMTGALLPTGGRVLLGGKDVHRDPSAKTLLGVVPDRPHVYEQLTALEFVRFIGALYGHHGAALDTRAMELFAAFELQGWEHRYLSTFSHGMRQKTLLVSALAHRPRILVVDEPMVGLDVQAGRTLSRLLKQFCHEGGTVVLTTHTVMVAEKLCDRVAIIANGQLVADGSPRDIIATHGEEDEPTLEDVLLRLNGGVVPDGPRGLIG